MGRGPLLSAASPQDTMSDDAEAPRPAPAAPAVERAERVPERSLRRPWPGFGVARLGRLAELVQAGNKSLPGVDADGLKRGNR